MMNFSTTTDLFDYQLAGVDKLARPRVGALFVEMGLGKTRMALELVIRRQARVNRVIIYCPVSLKETWEMEIRKHTDTPASQIHRFDHKTNMRNVPHDSFWHIVGIESMSSSDRIALAANSLTTTRSFVIVDESDYIKGHKATRTQRITRYSEDARYRLALTGTPISEGAQDLYAQMRFLSPKILGYGSFYSFAANHLEYSDKYPDLVVRAHNMAWLAAKMQPYTFQLSKADAGVNLPEKIYDSRYFSLSYEQREAYEQAKWEILMSAEEIDSYVIFQLFGALQQITSGFWNRNGRLHEYAHDRLDMLNSYIGSLAPSEKIIIWCKYRYSIHAVTESLAILYGRESVAQYYGDLNERDRAAELRRWRNEARFLVATVATGGSGLTLNESAYAIFYENEFKYRNRVQPEDRNHRIGQTQRPTYLDIWSRTGIEEHIAAAHARKGNAMDDFKRKVKSLNHLPRQELKKAVLNFL